MRIFQFIIISCLTLYAITDGESKDECTNINDEYACSSLEQTTYPDSYYIYQGNYRETYQDMHYLVGYAQLKYSSDRTI